MAGAAKCAGTGLAQLWNKELIIRHCDVGPYFTSGTGGMEKGQTKPLEEDLMNSITACLFWPALSTSHFLMGAGSLQKANPETHQLCLQNSESLS